MDIEKFERLISNSEKRLTELSRKKIFFVSNLIKGGLLQDKNILEKNAEFFPDNVEDIFNLLITSDFVQNYSFPALVDFRKTVELYKNSSLPENERISSAFLMSRVNFMGTDGIRGKVALDVEDDFLVDLILKNAFTPQLVEICAFSFANLLIEQDVLKENDTVVFGNDGRDRATGGKLKNAVIDGFNRAKVNVYDLGIIPTAFVPYQILKKGLRAGAVLTASHNPSNQNGIKIFFDGKKLLPEGEFGDYVLSAHMYYYCTQDKLPQKSGSVTIAENVLDESEKFVLSVLPKNTPDLLKDIVVVFDSANGAFTDTGKRVLNTLNVNYTSVNEVPDGANINRSCGVAELEGHGLFSAEGYNGYIPFVKEVFDIGRKNEPGKVYGIALDGDGDRGFLLYYDKEKDCIHPINGDKCGYILAEYFIKIKNLNPKDYYFVSTIESDLMTASSAGKVLGLNTKIVSVGDKWICNFKEGALLVGLEISGHLIFPISFKNDSGAEVTLLSGIGLLTGLMSLAAIKSLGLSPERAVKPFEPGISKTYYVFFVDKSKFYRNSNIWVKDCELIQNEISKFINEGLLSSDTELVFEGKEDPNILYVNIVNTEGLRGCIFIRNSGTEDKIATYVQGENELKEVLFYLGSVIRDNHISLMKNRDREEYKYETFIYTTLKRQKEIGFREMKTAMEKKMQYIINESDLFSVVYGLKKEGKIKFENKIIRLA